MTTTTAHSDSGTPVTINIDSTPEDLVEMSEAGTYRGYQIDDLQTMFNQLQDPTNWKRPFARIIPNGQVEIAKATTEFYVGGTLAVESKLNTGVSRVSSPGYYHNIGS